MHSPRLKLLGLLCLLMIVGRWLWDRPWVSVVGAPLVLGREPLQEQLAAPLSKLFPFQDEMSRIELTHRFEITGEAVAVTSYRWAYTNPYYQVDLGMAWGPRVETYKKRLKFSQAGRWLMWSARESLSPEVLTDMQTHIGNLHLIPASGRPMVDKAIHWIGKGDRVRIKGYLAQIFGPSGDLIVRSSTSRNDSGDGACEVVWVDEVQINHSIYK